MSKKKPIRKIQSIDTKPEPATQAKTSKKSIQAKNKSAGKIEQSSFNRYLFGMEMPPFFNIFKKLNIFILLLPLLLGILLFIFSISASDVKPSISTAEKLAKNEAILNSMMDLPNSKEKSIQILKAGEEIRNIVKEQPANPKAFLSLGMYYIGINKFDSAYFSFKKTLEIDNGKSYISNNAHNLMLNAALYYGNSMIQQKNYAPAKDILMSAVTFHPKNENLLLMSGYCYRQLGKLDSAAMLLEYILKYYPNNQQARENLNYIKTMNAPPTPNQ